MKKLYIALTVSVLTLTQAQAGYTEERSLRCDYNNLLVGTSFGDWLFQWRDSKIGRKIFYFISEHEAKSSICRDPFSEIPVSIKERDIDRVKRTGYGRNFDLSEADFKGADLKGANLEGAILCRANLKNADLRGASLKNANLEYANFRGACLTSVNLKNANIHFANFKNTYAHPAQFKNAVGISYARSLSCKRYLLDVRNGDIQDELIDPK